MDVVSFTKMHEGTREDYALLNSLEEEFSRALPNRILASLREMEQGLGGYRINRLEHSLQSATRAHRDGRDEEYVVAALVHDMGDGLAPHTHGEMMAAVMRPYFPERLCWIVKHHPAFQQYYYGHLAGLDQNAREKWRGHQWFDDCVEFCELYDENCFDPAYENLPLDFFEPMVRRVFVEPRYEHRN